ncbi:helix-turn-helix domain-containing protein [Paenibacillus sp. GCM10023248]|uniref:AraC family transcriptional regulator n=1 Tax=unclassified Paenibacillus TaxID=185978 RepID=UPI00237914A1|nr:AraC family transcriptional regulator [Paenibacillus sp. MAHUQ-63]MDD9269390.1 AraC family transcriptional regulator [Paenibacillus sp. MAHUQ-63]
MQIKLFQEYERYENQVWAQRSSHGQHNLFEEHGHDFIELVYVVQGGGRHRIQGIDYELRTGDVFIIMPGESHDFPDVKDFSLEIVNCLFRREAIASMLPTNEEALLELPYILPFYKANERFPKKLSLSSIDSTDVLDQLETIIREQKRNEAGANLIVSHLLIHLMIRLSRIANRPNPIDMNKPFMIGHEILARNVNTYLENNFEQKITTDMLAGRFTISPRHLHRIFRQQTGKSITETLQLIRIERAKQMLTETSRSIDSIASFVGFSDPSHFNRLFVRIAGSTPSGYRKQARKDAYYPKSGRI